MRFHLAILILTLATTVAADANKRPARVSGNQLVAGLRGGPNVRHEFDKPYLQGYIAGVADVTEGAQWCAPASLGSEQLDAGVLDALATRPASSMPEAAAEVLVEQLHSLFPPKGACIAEPRVSGDRFRSWLLGNVRERERYAIGYVGGVMDATQDGSWCAPTRIKPHELEERGWSNLVDRPPGSMPGNAATLLHQQFIAKYPCAQR